MEHLFLHIVCSLMLFAGEHSAAPLDTQDKPISPGTTCTESGIAFVWCPPGTFMMGTPESESFRAPGERPCHQVTLTHGFWLSKYLITQAQWESVMHENPSTFSGDGELPVESISWPDITGEDGFLDRLNRSNPKFRFRLPTEAEWEYACRAGTTTPVFWGEDPEYSHINEYTWYEQEPGESPPIAPCPVGQKSPNAWNLYDLSGNLFQWCQDWFGPYTAAPVTNPKGSEHGSARVLRGGNWSAPHCYCRSAMRSQAEPRERKRDTGLRIVMTPNVPPEDVLERFDLFLRDLDRSDPNSVRAAVAEYKKHIVPESQAIRDKAFVLFLTFHTWWSETVCRALLYDEFENVFERAEKMAMPKTEERTEFGQRKRFYVIDLPFIAGLFDSADVEGARARIVSDPNLSALLKRNGFVWSGDAEGGWLISHTPDFVSEAFFPYISRSLREYINLRRTELDKLFVGDGELGLSAEELGRRVAHWEKYLAGFPNSLFKDDALYLYKLYLYTFIKLDAYHYPTKETGSNGEFVKEWERYTKSHSDTKSGQIAGEYLRLLESHDYTISEGTWTGKFYDALDAYLDSLGGGKTVFCFLENIWRPQRQDLNR